MSFESVKNTLADNLNPGDFVEGFIDSAVRTPLNAIRQLRGHQVAESGPKSDSLAMKAGNIAGFIFDFTILNKITGGAMNRVLGKEAGTIAGSSAKMFVSGGIYGGVLTPSSNDKSLLTGRLENAAVSALSFAVMGGMGKALEGTSLLGRNALVSKAGSNAIAGGAGGVVEAYGSTYFHEGRLATPVEVLSTAGQYAAFGAGFGAFDYGLSIGARKIAKMPAVSHAYYETRWNLDKAQVEAKRMTYATLNKFDMRHPWQRIGDFIYGSGEAIEVPRAKLTAENNPVTAFEKELPEFFGRIREKERLMEQTADRKEQYQIYEDMGEVRAQFADKLLKWWHGTAEQPGIKSYSDGELATSTATAGRVAAIRKTLTLNAKGEYPEASPLSQGLADLAKTELPGGHDHYGILGELEAAKGRFFNYDEWELSRRMSMPAELHYRDHGYGTPLEWMPYEPTPELPNLFHGSVSHSLPSIFTERAMLPASELRLRGIEQITGESASEHFPRRSVSLTRDFSEAWAYHRHSPMYLDSYPVVFGVSADVIPRARTAGMLEPGEILIDKLGLGSSFLTRLGLRSPEITNLYVPDSEVAALVRQLNARRIKGVQVVGLSALPTPEWKHEPLLAEGEPY